MIDELVEASLLEPLSPDEAAEQGYRLHDLLRVYATELGGGDVAATALRGLLSVAVAGADTAARLLPRTLTWSYPESCTPAQLPDGMAERIMADPFCWFTASRAFLVSAVGTGYAAGVDRETVLLAERLAPFLWAGGHWIDLEQVRRLGCGAAERVGDERARLLFVFIGGVLQLVRGDLNGAKTSLQASRDGFELLGDAHGLACVLSDLAVLEDYHGEDAVGTAERAVALFEAAGDRLGAILASPGRSSALRSLGRLGEALEVDLASVAAARAVGAAPIVLARCLNALALNRLLSADPLGAYAAAEEATALLRRTGERYVLLATLRNLALAAAGLGRRAEAVHLLESSHEMAVELGDRVWATGLERDISVSWIGAGRAEEAVTVLLRCLGAYHEIGLRGGVSATLGMLARAYDALGRPAAARAARRGSARFADPKDARTPFFAKIVVGLADAEPGTVIPRG